MKAHAAYMLSKTRKNLISLGQPCDANMIIILIKEKLRVFDNDVPSTTVIESLHSNSDGM